MKPTTDNGGRAIGKLQSLILLAVLGGLAFVPAPGAAPAEPAEVAAAEPEEDEEGKGWWIVNVVKRNKGKIGDALVGLAFTL